MRNLLLAMIGLGIWVGCTMMAEYLETQRMRQWVLELKCPQ